MRVRAIRRGGPARTATLSVRTVQSHEHVFTDVSGTCTKRSCALTSWTRRTFPDRGMRHYFAPWTGKRKQATSHRKIARMNDRCTT